MERVGEWRMIEAEEPEEPGVRPGQPGSRDAAVSPKLSGRLLVAALAAGVLTVAGLAIWATLPQGGVKLDLAADPGAPVAVPSDRVLGAPGGVVASQLAVDIEGAVVEPGVHRVAADSRVADAIAAAGGYSTEVDIAAAAATLNLAARLEDGQKIIVPARGDVPTLSGEATAVPGGAPDLIDINHATSDELESLPGIGPVTAAKIITAREQQPFATLDELDSRGVIGPSTLEKIRDLITVTP